MEGSKAEKAKAKPVGQGNYVVRQGDCISSIAFEHGFFPDTLWNDPKNGELKRERKNPNVLLPGDRVYVRQKEEKDVPCASEKRHRFRRKGVPEIVKLVVRTDGEPMADQPYVLTVDGEHHTGTTDKNGGIKQWIWPNAASASLRVGQGPGAREYEIRLGYVNPISQTSGVKTRLRNLGYISGPPDEVMDDETRNAVKAFQRKAGLPDSGELDQATREALVREHGS